MPKKAPVFIVACCLLLCGRVVSADFMLDHFPLDQGSRWTYSASPSTVAGVFEFEVEGTPMSIPVSMTFGELTVSIPSEGRRHSEIAFTGTVTVDGLDYPFSGDVSFEEEYNLITDSIQLVSESLDFEMRIPSFSARLTLEGSGTYDPPLTVFEHGMQIGDTILYNGEMNGSLTLNYTEPGIQESDTVPMDTSVDTTVGIVGEEQISFNGKLLNTLAAQIDTTADGVVSMQTMNLARFIGPVRMNRPITGLEDFFDNLEDVTYTLLSTNLPIWEIIDTFAVDSSVDTSLDFETNGSTAEIVIPAGCLSDSCTIMVAEISNIPVSPGINGITWAVGVNIEELNITLNCPITVMIPYTQADLDSAGVTDPNDLKVYRWSSPSSGWVALQVTNVDTNNQTVSFKVSQFSVFGAGAPVPVAAGVQAVGNGGGGGGWCFITTTFCGSRMPEGISTLILFLGFGLVGFLGLKKIFKS